MLQDSGKRSIKDIQTPGKNQSVFANSNETAWQQQLQYWIRNMEYNPLRRNQRKSDWEWRW